MKRIASTRTVVLGLSMTAALGSLLACSSGDNVGPPKTDDVVVNPDVGQKKTDDEIKAIVEKAADGAWYSSEGDYPYSWVHAKLDDTTAEITEALVREKLASFIDNDEAADKPLASLYADEGKWEDWTAPQECDQEEDEYYREICASQERLVQALDENLSDVKVFYFGSSGAPGKVDGVAVSIILVGKTPSGNLAGVRTLAIWT